MFVYNKYGFYIFNLVKTLFVFKTNLIKEEREPLRLILSRVTQI